MLKQYPQKVKVVFKNFPLRSHTYAEKAALAVLAAHNQGKFWPFHDRLFENYRTLNDQTISKIRDELQIDQEKFDNDMTSPRTKAKLDGDVNDGRSADVRGTPTVFVNGRKLQDRSFNGFKKAVERELK